MKIELWAIELDDRRLVISARTNGDGRTETPLLDVYKRQAVGL